MYRRTDDFRRDWEHEAGTTLGILRVLDDASLQQRIAPGGRTLGRLAWHVAETIPEMLGHAGIACAGPPLRDDTPATAAEIVAAYEPAAAAVAAAVAAAWPDETLEEEVEMYGQRWRRGVVLSALILHQAHHRGQMTVLMRQAGLRVPGAYGPAAEEWAAMGMAPLA
jgi:uncharacterized damage-inducible protein DinB